MEFGTSSVTRRVTVNAPLPEVWGLVGNFHGLDQWHPAVEKSSPSVARKDDPCDIDRCGQFDLRPLFAIRGRDPTVVIPVKTVVEMCDGMDRVVGNHR